jgi:hypothetical protein
MSRVQTTHCAEDECSLPSYSKDLCRSHYSKLLYKLKAKTKICAHCSESMTNLGINQQQRKYCIVCSPPGDDEANQFLWKYQISRPEYDAMYFQQQGICAMPGCEATAKEVDHWHGCPEDHGNHRACKKCVRALLCRGCNNRLEPVEDRLFREAAMSYLDAYCPSENPGNGGGGMWS